MGKLSVLPKPWQFFVAPVLITAPGTWQLRHRWGLREWARDTTKCHIWILYSQIWGINKTNKQKTTEDSFCNTERAYYPRLDYSQQRENHWVLAYICSPICRQRIYLHMPNLFLEGIKDNPKKAICRATYITTDLNIWFLKHKQTNSLPSFLSSRSS